MAVYYHGNEPVEAREDSRAYTPVPEDRAHVERRPKQVRETMKIAFKARKNAWRI